MSRVYPGQQFTRLTVVGPATPSRWGRPRVECICVCGKTVISLEADLLRSDKSTKSCGCYRSDVTRQRNREHCEENHYRFVDLTGRRQEHGWLTAVKLVGFGNDRHADWECVCQRCGTVTVVNRQAFLSETTKSCGCWKVEADNDRFGEANPNFRHGRNVQEAANA
jgi:hypothetical protein